MPLNIANSGEFTPYLKYDAKSGRFKVRAEGSDTWAEIRDFNLAFDFENIRTGWIHYPQDGSPPHMIWAEGAKDNFDLGPRPGPEYKAGFQVAVFGNLVIPGTKIPMGLRTWSSNAFTTVAAINDMYAVYEEKLPENPGKVPIFAFRGVEEKESQYGTNYKPIFELVTWVDRAQAPALDAYQMNKVQIMPPAPRGPALPPPKDRYPQAMTGAGKREYPAPKSASPNEEIDDIPW